MVDFTWIQTKEKKTCIDLINLLLNRCIVDITSPPFCHGHLYVALSRIRNCENIKLFYNDDSLIDDDDNIPIIRNYVYKELSIE